MMHRKIGRVSTACLVAIAWAFHPPQAHSHERILHVGMSGAAVNSSGGLMDYLGDNFAIQNP
jgi:hypothetical protein